MFDTLAEPIPDRLLGRLVPDYKSIAEFRRMHREAVAEAGAAPVRFARSVGLVRGDWVDRWFEVPVGEQCGPDS